MRHVADLENQGYVHTHSAVERAGLSSLNEGQIVKYEIESAPGQGVGNKTGYGGFRNDGEYKREPLSAVRGHHQCLT